MITDAQKTDMLSVFEKHFGLSHAGTLFGTENFITDTEDGPGIDPGFLSRLGNSGWMFRVLGESFLTLAADGCAVRDEAEALALSLALATDLAEVLRRRLFEFNLDYINAISGERYESASVSSNRLILVPDEKLLDAASMTLLPR